MPAVKITNKPVSTPGDQTHFLVTQPELPEGYAPTGQETEEELAELKVESLREIEMDDMVNLFQKKFAFDSEPTAESAKPVTSAGIKAALDAADAKIGELKENINESTGDLKNAIDYVEDKVSFIDFLKSPVILAQDSQTGNYNTTTGAYISRTDRRSTPKIPVRKFTRIGTNVCSSSFLFWNDNGGFISVSRGTMASDGFYYADVPSGYTVFAWNVNNTGAEEPNLKLKYVSPIVNAVNKATSDLAKLTSMSIEGYTENSTSASGTLYTDKMISSLGNLTNAAGWNCLEIDVEGGDILNVSGTGNPVLFIKDSNGNKVDVYAPGINVNVVDYRYTVPANGTKMYINRSNAVPVAKLIDLYQFVKADGIAKHIGGTEYNVGNGDFVYTVLLNGSENGAFRYKSLLLNGSQFKPVGDDIAPVSTDANYIGGNHGYLWEYVCTSTAHGLTESDIGKTYNDGTNTWVLLRVNSTDSFSLGCYDSSKWWKLKNATVPATVNFGSSVSISTSSLKQFLPSIRNKNVLVIENSTNAFAVLESYDIWDIGTGIDAIIANVGNNTNESLINLSDKAFTIRNVYIFDKNCNVVQYVDFFAYNASIKMNSFAGSQCAAFGTGDYIAVLGSSADTLQNSILSFSKSTTWDSESKAPFVFFKASADKGKGFVIVYLDDRTSNLFDSAGYVATSTNKLYPHMIQKNEGYEGQAKNIILRMPVVKNNSGADYVSFVDVGNKTYMFVGLLTAKTTTIDVPFNVIGKKISALSNSGIVCKEQLVHTGIEISSSGEAYALIEFS